MRKLYLGQYNAALIFNIQQHPVRAHRNTRTILFDLDGTLLDSTDLILQCFEHSWQTVCGLYHSREALLETFGTPLRAAMYRLLNTHQQPRDTVNDPSGEAANEDVIDQLLAAYRTFWCTLHSAVERSSAWQRVLSPTLSAFLLV